MKFGAGVPSWLGALLVIGPPTAITGLVTSLYEAQLPAWALLPVGILTLIVSSIAWLGIVSRLENRRDRNKAKRSSTQPPAQ